MIQTITTYLSREFPQLKAQKLLLGASGGLDSTVLAYVLIRAGYMVSLAHCNFQLRGAAALADEAFVKKFAADHNVPFYGIRFETKSVAAAKKISIQMAARALRYDWFDQLRNKHHIDLILTAHHADDNLETFLINFLRGTGIDGLTGIPSQQGHIVRPLLTFSRAELEQLAITEKLTWREDLSNRETNYLRNKLRLGVIPELKAIEPSLLSSLHRTTQYLKDSRAIIDRSVTEIKAKVMRTAGKNWIIDLEKLTPFQPVSAYLYELLKPYGFSAWTDIEQLLTAQTGKQIFSKTHVLLKDRNTLCLSLVHTATKTSYELTLDEPLVTDVFTLSVEASEDLAISKASHIAVVDADKISFPLRLRKWKEGDYFYPIGLGGKKKISKFFKDQKFSLRQKEEAWLLCDASKVIWVVNQRIDERVAITSQTKSTLKITVDPH